MGGEVPRRRKSARRASSTHERIGAPLFAARNQRYWTAALLSLDRNDDVERAIAMLERACVSAHDQAGVVILRDATHLNFTARAPR